MFKKLSILSLILLLSSCQSNKNPGQEQEEAAKNTSSEQIQEAAKNQLLEDKKIFFAYDSAVLSKNAKEAIALEVLAVLKDNPEAKILIEGHCDERGSKKYNYKLGKKRANAVRNYLFKKGVSKKRIKTVSYGETRPVALGHDESAWSQNRRAVIISVIK